MALVSFCRLRSEIPVGAENVQFELSHTWRRSNGIDAKEYMTECPGPSELITYETYAGCCLAESEHNMSDDSDFYMLVWSIVEQRPFRVMFATTRGWTYPCLASRVDATPEIRAAHEAHRKAATRRHRIQAAWAKRCALSKLAKEARVSVLSIRRLRNATTSDQFEGATVLLTSKLRSAFRLSLKAQLLAWLESSETKHASPFTRKQWAYVE